jgi:sterol desaturase/sphingolipid hydroxylase (fatty acid hydroxylase superfamily)
MLTLQSEALGMFWQGLLVWFGAAGRLHQVTMNISRAFAMALVTFIVLYCLELYYGVPTNQYRTRGFLHDLFWWLWTSSGLNRIIFTSAVVGFLTANLSPYKLNLLDGVSAIPRYILYFVVIDFFVYWVHRWRHANRFMWAFHTTHHSQEQLSFLTVLRIHPVEFIFNDLIMFVPLLVVGAPPQSWLPLYYARVIIEDIQHSRLPWTFGPLYYVFVSPVFHSFHHSVRPEHHDRNFAVALSLWDFMFGTAVAREQRPSEYGLADIKTPTLLSSLVVPFRVLRQTYSPRAQRQRSDARQVAR